VSSNKLKELSLPYFYAILQQPDALMQAMVEWLSELKAQGKVSKLALAYVNDLFGIEMHASATAVLKGSGLSVAETKNYPLGVKDLAPILKGFKASGIDVLVGLTYPPDNILLTTQAKETDFNPPVYFTAVGTAFPFYRDRFKGAEGVSGIAGWNPKVKTPGAREYFEAHVKKTGKEPDRWASAFAYASLQIIERCVGEVGLDRKRMKEMLDGTEFTTVVGPVRFTRGFNAMTPGMVGQWQKGEFEIVWPRSWATAAAIVPKPGWA
jgi:branched-chain amino acid transport system substrate-binding protein